MQTARFYGASDDLVEVEGIIGEDDFDDCGRGGKELRRPFIIGESILVWPIYTGCWSFAIGQVKEEVTIPEYPIRFRNPHGNETSYSVVLEIDVPDGISVRRLTEEEVREL